MAEALALRYAQERRWRLEARSAGTHALSGQPAAPNSARAVKEVGGDLSAHVAQPVTAELVDWAHRILVMEMRHAGEVRHLFPASDEKLQLLGTFGGIVEIGDPYGGWIFRYRRSRDEIRRCVEAFLDSLPPRPV
jgi:protein-tyrosine phosphatase